MGLGNNVALLIAAPVLNRALFILVLVIVNMTRVLRGRDPQARLATLHWLVLRREVDALAIGASVAAGMAALRQCARAGRQVGSDGSVLLDPVRERVLAVLNDAVFKVSLVKITSLGDNIRLASLVAIVRGAGLAGSHRSVVNELQQVLAVASNNSELLAVLTKSIKLVCESGLQLLTGNVGKLGLGNEGLGLSTDELLLKNNNPGRVGLLVLELGNLVGDLLLPFPQMLACFVWNDGLV